MPAQSELNSLEAQVRDALTHLYDPVHLQTHPLAARLGGGRALRRALEEAVDALRPERVHGATPRAARQHELLKLRYLDALPVEAVQERLAVGRSEYYREHVQAVEAVASLLRERVDPGAALAPARAEPPEKARGGDPAPAATAPPPRRPRPLSSFVGREAEVADVRRRLRTTQIVTLTGAPGTGKTRLALRVADEAAVDFPDGVVFVALGAVGDSELVLPAVAQALGVRDVLGRSTLEGVVGRLGGRRLLLLLDNFEQVVAAGPLVADVLAACPGTCALVTSREALRVSGEHTVAVPPLAVPTPGAPLGSDELLAYGAIRLFVERAEAASGAALPAEDAPAVAEICRRLDGLPLAIELAAARVRVLTPRALLARLERALPVLTGGPRDLPDRQRTLRAALEWSHALLDGPERALFRRLGVFVEGATLDAVEAVCGHADGEPDAELLDRLGSLVDKSLVDREVVQGEPRFTMLLTLREYALEQLEASGEAAAVRRAHLAHLVELAEAAEPQVVGGRAPPPEQRAWLDRLERERDNLRAACAWAAAAREGDLGLRLVGALMMSLWMWQGSRTEGRSTIATMLEAAPESAPPASRAKALWAVGTLAWVQGDLPEARARLEQGLTLCGPDDAVLRAHLAQTLGFVHSAEGAHAEARRLVAGGMATVRELGTTSEIALWTYWLGALDRALDDTAGTRGLVEESLALFERAGDEWGMAMAQMELTLRAFSAGELVEAAAWAEAAERLFVRIADQGGSADAQSLQAIALVQAGDHPRAWALYRRCLPAHREQLNRVWLAAGLEGVALLIAGAGEHAAVLRLAAAADTLRRGADWGIPGGGAELAATLVRARDAIGPGAAEAAEAAGRTMTPEQAVADALSHDSAW